LERMIGQSVFNTVLRQMHTYMLRT
jgi:hypothetical protein